MKCLCNQTNGPCQRCGLRIRRETIREIAEKLTREPPNVTITFLGVTVWCDNADEIEKAIHAFLSVGEE